MSVLQCSPQQLRRGAANAAIIENAISVNPVNALGVGDIGHAGVSAALEAFRTAWSGEFRLRSAAAQQASRLLQGAAADTERADALLARAASRLGGER